MKGLTQALNDLKGILIGVIGIISVVAYGLINTGTQEETTPPEPIKIITDTNLTQIDTTKIDTNENRGKEIRG